MTLVRYSGWVAVAVAAPLGLLALLWRGADPLVLRSAALGGALAGANAVLAYGTVIWSQRRSTRVFLGAVLGGMFVRMALLLAAVVAGLLVLDLERIPLVTSLLCYFLVFLVLEIKTLQRVTTVRPQ